MNITPPPFVKVINGIWCLAGDNSITSEIGIAQSLTWDKTFQDVINRLQASDRSGYVIDIGAYIGDSSAWFTRAGFPTIAFECQRDAFLCLTRNCPECMAFNFPVGNGEHVYINTQQAGNLGARSVAQAIHSGTVATLRIDDLAIEKVALIKIDVEGWEPNVLLGAVETIRRCKPLVLVEVNPAALEKSGFSEKDIYYHFDGWKREEIFRYYDENWDIMFTP